MSFFIISSDPGVARLHIEGGLDEATTYILRWSSRRLLRRRPSSRRSLAARPGSRSTTRPAGLLLSFFELLRAHGGRLTCLSAGVRASRSSGHDNWNTF